MLIDVLTMVMGYALTYMGVKVHEQGPAQVNWTAIGRDTWWGPGEKQASQNTAIHKANITFDDKLIEDLRWRLKNHVPMVKPLEGIGFEYGFNTDQINNWTKFWSEEYDFKAREKDFNKYPMYTTNIQGLDIFFVRVTPPKTNKKIVPLLLVHGWPGSIKEFWDAIPRLTAVSNDRDFVVEVVVPCLPGFGWSQTAARPGLGLIQTANIFRNLMQRLGHKQFYVQGGDLGASVTSHLATLYPEEVLGYHTNQAKVLTPFAALIQILGTLNPSFLVEPAFQKRMYPVFDIYSKTMTFAGYFHEQCTKPDTIGIPMIDSPTALLAYVVEKMISYNLDRTWVIDNLMVYWSTKTGATAARMYSETFNKKHFGHRLEEIPIYVPTWVAQSPDEITYQSPTILKMKYKNILNIVNFKSGGHFLAAEKPKEFSADVLEALKAFTKVHKHA